MRALLNHCSSHPLSADNVFPEPWEMLQQQIVLDLVDTMFSLNINTANAFSILTLRSL